MDGNNDARAAFVGKEVCEGGDGLRSAAAVEQQDYLQRLMQA